MPYTVSDFIEALSQNGLLERKSLICLDEKTVITNLSFDNRTVRPGGLFVCKGAAFRVEYLHKAKEAGALLYVSEVEWESTMPHLLVKDIRHAMAVMARLFYEKEAKDLCKIGVTGTKGKTTVVTYLNAILDDYYFKQYSLKTAVISSLVIYDGDQRRQASLSTPEAFDLWKSLAAAGKHHLGYAVCEVSSQALKYRRTEGIAFDIAAFLNIGEDHISDIEHKDFEDYFSSKLKIFDFAKSACLFSGSDHFDVIKTKAVKAGCTVRTFGYEEGDDVFCTNRVCRRDGASFTVFFRKSARKESFSIGLAGRYNVDNALAALAIAEELGIPHDAMRSGLLRTSVAGRGEHLASKDAHYTVIVDYAHNKMSLEALLAYASEAFAPKPIVTLFGCPGKKAKNRRRDMGLAAGRLSDYVLVTEDDPADEPLDEICREIARYVAKGSASWEIVPDRKAAIRRAFALVKESGGVILLCGKGAENSQKRAEGSVLYETDKYIAQQCIDEYEKSMALEAAMR